MQTANTTIVSPLKNVLRFTAVLLLVILGGCGWYGKSSDDIDQNIAAEMLRASACMNEGNPDASLEIYRHLTQYDPSSLSIATRNELVRCYSNMGYILMFERQDYLGSYEALMEGKEIAEKLPNCPYLPEIYLNLAAVFGVYGDTRLSQQYVGKAFDEALYRRKWDALLTAVYNMGIDEIGGNLGSDCQQRLDRFARIKVPEHPMRDVATGLVRAYTLCKENKGADAIGTLEQIKSLDTTVRTPERVAILCEMYAMRIALDYSLDSAAQHYALALEHKTESTDADLKIPLYKNLAQYYTCKSEPKLALRCQMLSDQISDSIFAVSKYSLLHDLHINNQKKRHNEAINAERSERKRWVVGFVIATSYIIILLVAVALIVRKNRKLQARNRELYIRYAQSQQQTDELVQLRSSAPLDTEAVVADANGLSDPDEREQRCVPNLTGLAEKVVAVFNDEVEVAQQDFSLDKLARLTNSNRNYVSQVINSVYKKNFNTVLGEARVRLACKRLSDSGVWRNMTLEALAESVGFKSRSNFVVVFKKITGLSPSEYRKQIISE